MQKLFITGCDLKTELHQVKTKLYHEIIVAKKPAIYNPDEFKVFCREAGAELLFDYILTAVSSERISSTRLQQNKVRTVAIIYQLCYALSQVCNVMQVDHALYLKSNNVNNEGFDTEFNLGQTCSRRKIDMALHSLASSHARNLQQFFNDAIQNKWFLVLIVDDFTKIHTNRRPLDERVSDTMSMCTIVVKAFKSLPAMRVPKNRFILHNPSGISLESCTKEITSASSMSLLGKCYASTMPEWLTREFFTPEVERHIIDEHLYCDDDAVRHMRSMEDLHLLNFFELQLKSKEGFATAYDIALSTGLKQYLKRFVVLQPGDWPSQFYSRQIIYEGLSVSSIANNQQSQKQNMNPTQLETEHPYYVNNRPVMKLPHSLPNPPCYTGIIPHIGPLHISLNSREHVFIVFKPFFRKVYAYLFPRSKLAEKPKPWRINLILEIVYGAWTIIRNSVKSTFVKCKDVQYSTLLNLLDNYLPLVLSIYSITLKRNNFPEYKQAMIRIWTMFLCFKRRHYNKAPLVWLSGIAHLAAHFHDLYATISKYPNILDEYPVENTHGILRAQTKPGDTAAVLTERAKSIFESKERQSNFRSVFTPHKQSSFSHNQLQNLKMKCAEFLTEIVEKMSKQTSELTAEKKKGQHYLPVLFGEVNVTSKVLPVGYHTPTKPNQQNKCDLSNCLVENDEEPWSILEGCAHSFHHTCLQGLNHCPICEKFLTEQIHNLGSVAKDAIVGNENTHSKSQSEAGMAEDVENEDDGTKDVETEDEANSNKIPQVPSIPDRSKFLCTKITALRPACPLMSKRKMPAVETPSKRQAAKHRNKSLSKVPCNDNARKNHNVCPQKAAKQPSSSFQPVLVTRHDYPGVIEWVLPSTLCQSHIFDGMPLGSNACTVISVLWCLQFLSGQLNILTSPAQLSQTIDLFKQTMIKGNLLYNGLHVPAGSPNLDVGEVVQMLPSLNFLILEDLGYFAGSDIVLKFNEMMSSAGRKAGVLIIAPDKSMAILQQGNTISLYDSHQHISSGAVIATSNSGSGRSMVEYIQSMARKTWNTSLDGCNFALIAQRT